MFAHCCFHNKYVFDIIVFYKVSLTSLDVTFLILKSINFFLFFILSMCANIFLSVKYSETISMSIVLVLSVLILLADIFIKPISIITYGDISSQIKGIAIQFLAGILLNLWINVKVKKIDF